MFFQALSWTGFLLILNNNFEKDSLFCNTSRNQMKWIILMEVSFHLFYKFQSYFFSVSSKSVNKQKVKKSEFLHLWIRRDFQWKILWKRHRFVKIGKHHSFPLSLIEFISWKCHKMAVIKSKWSMNSFFGTKEQKLTTPLGLFQK